MVEIDGSISEIKILRGIGSGCDEEAIRVLKMSPKWSPEIRDGKPIRRSMVIPMEFSFEKN
jgi:protein TonB